MYTWTGTYLRVQVIRSTDGGTTWSKPVPVAPATDTHDQFFPSLSVSPTGKVGVSWLDRRNDPKNVDYQAFAAISTDGGKTFPNTQLTKAFSDPDTNGTGNNWMGDYTGNTWAGGKFIVAWMDSSNGVDMQEVIGGVRLK
jgi:Neuraminidase (sialidase)